MSNDLNHTKELYTTFVMYFLDHTVDFLGRNDIGTNNLTFVPKSGSALSESSF